MASSHTRIGLNQNSRLSFLLQGRLITFNQSILKLPNFLAMRFHIFITHPQYIQLVPPLFTHQVNGLASWKWLICDNHIIRSVEQMSYTTPLIWFVDAWIIRIAIMPRFESFKGRTPKDPTLSDCYTGSFFYFVVDQSIRANIALFNYNAWTVY